MKQRTSLVILAGGQGTRLGGQDKGLLRFGDKPLVEHLLLRFAPQVDDVWIIANRNLAAYRQLAAPFAAKVVADLSDGFQGPLMGILSGLEQAQGEQVLVLPGDAARLPNGLLGGLQQTLRATAASAAFAAVHEQDQPLCCLLKRELRVPLAQAFASGTRSPARWLAAMGAARCDFGEAGSAACWSINTPQELEQQRNLSGLAPTGDLLFLAQEK